MSSFEESIIAKRAAELRYRMGEITTIYGCQFDITDSDHLILAAFSLGEKDEMARGRERIRAVSKVLWPIK